MERNLSHPVRVEPGQIIVKDFKVTLTASSNQPMNGSSRTATLSILGPNGCVLQADGGARCSFDGGSPAPAVALFLDGSRDLSVFPNCAAGVACEQTIQVRLTTNADVVAPVTVNVELRALVLNAGTANEGLQIVPQ